MLRTGQDYIEAMKDGRQVFVGGELIDDITTHPAFAGSVTSTAKLYDLTSTREELTYVEPETGERTNLIFKRPRNADDLRARRRVHEAWAEQTHGMIGRSPDHVAGFITGMACMPETAGNEQFSENLTNYWRYIRDNDLFVSYAVLPPAGAKGDKANPDDAHNNALRVVHKDDTGITVRGFKMLATGGVLCDEILIGNLLPLPPHQSALAVTFAIPAAANGVKILSRKPYAASAVSAVDEPLTTTVDETDAAIYCDDVYVPWSRVFVLDDVSAARSIFNDTPAHTLGNAQAHIRLLSKMRFMLGTAKKFADRMDMSSIPPVQAVFGGLAGRLTILEGLLKAQELEPHVWEHGYVGQNKPTLYATMNWTMEYFSQFAQEIRALLGSHPFQQPSNISALDNELTRKLFLEFNRTDDLQVALDNYRLVRLLWDQIGSEFASRHLQYEIFYAGPPHVTRARMYGYFDWDQLTEPVTRFLDNARPQMVEEHV